MMGVPKQWFKGDGPIKLSCPCLLASNFVKSKARDIFRPEKE